MSPCNPLMPFSKMWQQSSRQSITRFTISKPPPKEDQRADHALLPYSATRRPRPLSPTNLSLAPMVQDNALNGPRQLVVVSDAEKVRSGLEGDGQLALSLERPPPSTPIGLLCRVPDVGRLAHQGWGS